jgi:hypothetical protein
MEIDNTVNATAPNAKRASVLHSCPPVPVSQILGLAIWRSQAEENSIPAAGYQPTPAEGHHGRWQ